VHSQNPESGFCVLLGGHTSLRRRQPLYENTYSCNPRLRDGNLTQAEGEVIMVVMAIYRGAAADLARWGFIKGETRDLVVAAISG